MEDPRVEDPRKVRFEERRRVYIGVATFLLLLTILCCATIMFMLNRPSTAMQQPLAEQQLILPTWAAIPTPTVSGFLPFIANALKPTLTAIPTPAPTTEALSIWRIVHIDQNDVGTLESMDDPTQKVTADCIDPFIDEPKLGTLFQLKKSGVFEAVDENIRDKVQRFELLQTGK